MLRRAEYHTEYDIGGGRTISEEHLGSVDRMENALDIVNLKFKYDPTSPSWILGGINMSIPRGSYSCIVGPSGCGKSTLLSILMRFRDPVSGSIVIDKSVDISKHGKRSYMDQVSVVFQDLYLVNGSIMDNIRYGRTTATDEECIAAARRAECHFIKDLRDGFETEVGQHSTVNVSGGQAQRICLARALVRNPRILLLDEATSALDQATEHSVVQTLIRLAKQEDMTIISVTHRLQTTLNANQIFVMNKGQIQESGTYVELLERRDLFAELVNVEKETKK